MPNRYHAIVRFAIMALGLTLAVSVRAQNDGGAVTANDVEVLLRCPSSQGTGRVRCTVDAVARAGESITWADVVIVSTPAFATPLRGRLAPQDAIDATTDRWRWEFALAARTRGHGDVTVRLRAVVCTRGSNGCAPWHRDVTSALVVGE